MAFIRRFFFHLSFYLVLLPPVQCIWAGDPHRVTRGLGGVVPASGESGALGTGWCCGHRIVCAGNPVFGRLRSGVWMLLQLNRREPEEEEDKEAWSDLDEWEELSHCRLYSKMNVVKMENLLEFNCPPVDHFWPMEPDWIFHCCISTQYELYRPHTFCKIPISPIWI